MILKSLFHHRYSIRSNINEILLGGGFGFSRPNPALRPEGIADPVPVSGGELVDGVAKDCQPPGLAQRGFDPSSQPQTAQPRPPRAAQRSALVGGWPAGVIR